MDSDRAALLLALDDLADEGQHAAVAFASEADGTCSEQQLLESAESQLEAFAFSSAHKLGGHAARMMQRTGALCEKWRNEAMAWAFEEQGERERSPRMTRLMVQVAIGHGLSEKGSRWDVPARAYMAILQVPGAVSYQMFRQGLVRKVMEKVAEEAGRCEEEAVNEVVKGMLKACEEEAVMARVVKEELVGGLLKAVVMTGPRLSEENRTNALRVVNKVYFQDAREKGEEGEKEMESEYEEMELQMAGKRRQSFKGKVAEETRAVILKCLLEIYRNEKNNNILLWTTDIFKSIIQKESALLNTESEDPDEFSTTALRVFEHLCFQVGEKSDEKITAGDNLLLCISKTRDVLSDGTLSRFFRFLSKLSNSKESNQRSFAAQIAGGALCFPDLEEDLVLCLVEIVLTRSEDRVLAVRNAALKGVGNIVMSPFFVENARSNSGTRKLVRNVVSDALKVLRKRVGDPKPVARRTAVKSLQHFICSDVVRANRSTDELILRDFTALCERARDTATLIRSAVLQSAQKFMQSQADERVLRIWADSVMSLIYDSEQTVQKAARNSLREVVFDAIVEWAKNPTVSSAQSTLPGDFAKENAEDDKEEEINVEEERSIKENEPLDSTTCVAACDQVWKLVCILDEKDLTCLRKAYFELSRKDEKGKPGMAVKPLVKAIQKSLRFSKDFKNDSEDLERVYSGAWTIFDVVLGGGISSKTMTQEDCTIIQNAINAVKVADVVDLWNAEYKFQETRQVKAARKSMFGVIMGLSALIPRDNALQIADNVFQLILDMDMQAQVLRKGLHLLVSLCEAKTPDHSEALEMILGWGNLLKQACEEILENMHARLTERDDGDNKNLDSDEIKDIRAACQSLLLLGELAVLGLDPDDKSKAYIPLSEKLTTLTMGLLVQQENNHFDSEGKVENDVHCLELRKLRLDLRAYAFAATGKLCLRDEKTAKRAMRMFVRELDQSSESDVVRSNVIVILGDLCRRYTNMVDPYMDIICTCLADPSPIVRRNALILLTALLQEDYIKWRGILFARYLMCAVDPDPEIRELVRFSIKDIFAEKSPGLYHGQFVELLHALNGFVTPKYQVASLLCPPNESCEGKKELEESRTIYVNRVTGTSKTAADLRFQLYTLLLDNMSDTHRLEVTNKICRDILGEILDGNLRLPPSIDSSAGNESKEPFDQLLSDCFAVLCCPQIRVKSTTSSTLLGVAVSGDGDEDISLTVTANVQDKLVEAKSKVLAKLEKKNLTDNVIPLVVSFYRMLQRERSPYLKYTWNYLRSLMEDFKEEMAVVLGGDKTLSDEIKYDIERAKKEEEKQRELKENSAYYSNRKRKSISNATSEKRKRRVSGITYHPSAKDVAARSASGVLKTPIPKSSKKKRRQSLSVEEVARLQAEPAPRLCSEKKAMTISKSSIRDISRTPLAVIPHSQKARTGRTNRKWSIEPSSILQQSDMAIDESGFGENISKNLTEQLMAMDER